MLRLLFVSMLSLAYAPALAGGCQPLTEALVETHMEAVARHGQALLLTGKQASDYLAVVNEVPPVSHLAGEGVMLLILEQGTVIGIVMGERVCIVGHVGADVNKLALKAAQGEDT